MHLHLNLVRMNADIKMYLECILDVYLRTYDNSSKYGGIVPSLGS